MTQMNLNSHIKDRKGAPSLHLLKVLMASALFVAAVLVTLKPTVAAAASPKASAKKTSKAAPSGKPAVRKPDTTGKPAPGTKGLEEWNQVKFKILNLFGGNATVPPKETWKDFPPVTGRVMTELATDPQSGQQQRMSAIFSLANFPDAPGSFKACSEIAKDEKEAKFYRDAAIGCLCDGFPSKAVPVLKEAAKSPQIGTRLSAISGLAKIKTKEADGALEKLLPVTKEPMLKAVIQQRLDEAKGAKPK